MDTPDEIRHNKWMEHNAEIMDAPRTCGLCGIIEEESVMACDIDACECYCSECIKDGEVERYLERCDYTKEMIDNITKQIRL